MALSEPFDILADFPGWTTDFDIPSRDEQSATAGGRVITKDMGPPLWTTTLVSKTLRSSDLDEWRAKLQALQGTQQQFLGYSLSKVWPRLYPRGSWPTGGSFTGFTANLSAVAADRKTIKVSALPAGFQLSVGDLLQIGTTDLHRVGEAATAPSGTTGDFEVYPNIWPGVTTATAVSVKRPHCLMAVVPGSVSAQADPSTGSGTVSFQGYEARL